MAWNTGLVSPYLDIAAYQGSPLRVMAGPGTGKTFALMRRVARLLESGVLPSSILAVTFTRTAANDLVYQLNSLGTPGASRVT
jgi:superfamily I DNA/RNA helicase